MHFFFIIRYSNIFKRFLGFAVPQRVNWLGFNWTTHRQDRELTLQGVKSEANPAVPLT